MTALARGRGRPIEHVGCSVPGCPSPHFCRTRCRRHYLQVYRHGTVLADTAPGSAARRPSDVRCACGEKALLRRRRCPACYKQWLRSTTARAWVYVRVGKKRAVRLAQAPSEAREAFADRVRAAVADALSVPARGWIKACRILGCQGRLHARGHCKKHYDNMRRTP